MTKQEFFDKCKELELMGYKKNFKYDEPINDNGTHYLYKVIEYANDKYGDNRAYNQLILKVWNLEKYADRVPVQSLYSISPVIMISRDTDERIDLHLSYPKRDIKELEKIAKDFGEWVNNYKGLDLKQDEIEF